MRHLIDFLLRHDHWLLFVLLEIFSITLLFRFNSYQGSVFFTCANGAARFVHKTAEQVSQYFGLTEVNRQLTNRNIALELQVEQLSRALERFNKDTTQIASLREDALLGCQLIDAQVVNNSLTQADNYITIDKGRADGIRPEMGVISGYGVVGIVYLAGEHYSVVLPVLNSKSSISCKIRRTSYFGFLKWDGGSSRYALVKDMPRHSEFSLGDTIVTSGHSAVFPAGIPVGTVDDMTDSHDGLSYLLRVKLFTDFARLNDVCVIVPADNGEQTALEDSILMNNL